MKNFNKIKEQMQKKMPPQMAEQIDPGMDQGQPEMTPDEMQADLKGLMSKVDSKYQNLSSVKIQGQNNDKDTREGILNQLFEMLAQAGIDGSDPEQMNNFLERIKIESPEKYQFFSDAISSLMGGDTSIQTEQPVDNTSTIQPEMSM